MASFCREDFSNNETVVESNGNIVIVTTVNSLLSSSLQNNYNILEYVTGFNEETKKKEYYFVFKNSEEAKTFILNKLKLFPAKTE